MWVRAAPVVLEPTPDMPVVRASVNHDPQLWGAVSSAFYW